MRKATTKEIESVAAKFGNGAHVLVPKDWVDRTVKVILVSGVKAK